LAANLATTTCNAPAFVFIHVIYQVVMVICFISKSAAK